MIQPGFRECPVSDLNPRLQAVLTPPVDGIAQPVLCYEKFWDGELAAYILTRHSAIRATYALDPQNGEQHSLDLLPYAEIETVQENRIEADVFQKEFALDLVARDRSRRLRFHFIRQDQFYEKFLAELNQRVTRTVTPSG